VSDRSRRISERKAKSKFKNKSLLFPSPCANVYFSASLTANTIPKWRLVIKHCLFLRLLQVSNKTDLLGSYPEITEATLVANKQPALGERRPAKLQSPLSLRAWLALPFLPFPLFLALLPCMPHEVVSVASAKAFTPARTWHFSNSWGIVKANHKSPLSPRKEGVRVSPTSALLRIIASVPVRGSVSCYP